MSAQKMRMMYMKKRSGIFILMIFTLVIIAFLYPVANRRLESIVLSTREEVFNLPYQWPTPVPIHNVLEIHGLKIKWQLDNVNSSVSDLGPYMAAGNGKIVFLGSLKGDDSYHAIILNAIDGTQFADLGPVGFSAQFTVDDSAIYFGKPDEIKKIDYQSGQQIWLRSIGHFNVPRFFRIVNGELQSSWNVNTFFVLSTEDGKILQKMDNVVTPIFLLENNIIYYESSPGTVNAKTLGGNEIWTTHLADQPITQAPIFTKNRIYLRTGVDEGKIYTVDRHSGQVIWSSDGNVLGSIAFSKNRLYYLTWDGYFLGVNPESGEQEALVKFSPEEFYQWQAGPPISFQVGYDELTGNILLLIGDSAQLFAFEETK